MKNLFVTTFCMAIIVSSAQATSQETGHLPIVKKLQENSVLVGMYSSILTLVDLAKARNKPTSWSDEKLVQIKNELSRAKSDIETILDQIPLDGSACYVALENLKNRGVMQGSAWTMQMDGKAILTEDEQNALGVAPHKANFKPSTDELQANANRDCK